MDYRETSNESRVASGIAIGKDAVALLRDVALFSLGVLLILFPARLNTVLVDAGFEEGSVVGFKWKSGLVESDNALKKAQATISELQAKNDQLVAALSDAKVPAADSTFRQRVDKLETDNRRLRDSTQQVQEAVSRTIDSNAPLVEKVGRAAVSRSRSDFNVGIQTVGVSDEERKTLNEKVGSEGYGLDPTSLSYPAGERPSWFAPRSTVFYYAASALPTARDVARLLKAATGQDFVVQKGAGLGVDPARRDVTIYVNYVKSP